MDLSSIICKSKEPACSLCPIENTCSKFIEVIEGPKQSPFKGSSERERKNTKTIA